jgi:hypothetical protein
MEMNCCGDVVRWCDGRMLALQWRPTLPKSIGVLDTSMVLRKHLTKWRWLRQIPLMSINHIELRTLAFQPGAQSGKTLGFWSSSSMTTQNGFTKMKGHWPSPHSYRGFRVNENQAPSQRRSSQAANNEHF